MNWAPNPLSEPRERLHLPPWYIVAAFCAVGIAGVGLFALIVWEVVRAL